MSSRPQRQLTDPLYQMMALLLQEWRALANIVLQAIPFFAQTRRQGMYEILEYDSTLDLIDPRG